MSDEIFNDSDLYGTSAKLWAPSSVLRGRLLFGVAAALGFGGLVAASALAAQAQGQGFIAACVLGVASVMALGGVLWTYLGIGHEVDSLSLRKSSWCALGILFLWGLLAFTEIDRPPAGWGTLILIAIAAGLVGLLVLAFHSPGQKTDPAVPKGSKAGWGGLGIALAFLAKFGFKFLVVFGIKDPGWALSAGLLLLISCTVGFIAWFAICKIRLRDKLGGFAAFVGTVEILGLISMGIFVAYMMIAVYEATQQTGLDKKAKEELEEYWRHLSLVVAVYANLAWAALTALLFLTLWTRHDPEADWLRDMQNAEKSY